MATTSAEKDDHSDSRALDRLMTVLWTGIGIGAIALIASYYTGLIAAAGIGVLIFLASFTAGCFLGFLFGLPRVPSGDQSAPPHPAGTTSASPSSNPATSSAQQSSSSTSTTAPVARARLLQSNTNLERISDWLTTMLVGATLVELHNINDGLVMFRTFLQINATVFHEPGGKVSAGVLPAVGPIVLVMGAICGFLFMYLSTRLVLVRLFAAIEGFLSSGSVLSASQQRAVTAFAHQEDGVGNFVRQNLTATRAVTVDDALNLMFDLLYKDNPDRVIELGTQLAQTDAAQRADYWFYLAAGFGQKLHRLDPSSPEWLTNRDNALDCARRAVAIDPSYRNRLWNISDPQSSDNDLAPLRKDAAFLRIVGRNES